MQIQPISNQNFKAFISLKNAEEVFPNKKMYEKININTDSIASFYEEHNFATTVIELVTGKILKFKFNDNPNFNIKQQDSGDTQNPNNPYEKIIELLSEISLMINDKFYFDHRHYYK